MIKKLISSNQKFIKHNLFSYFVIIFNILTSLYAVRENLKILNQELYGIWILVFSTMGILAVLHFGFVSIAIMRFGYFKSENKLTQFYSQNLFIILAQIALTIIVFCGLYHYSYLIILKEELTPVFQSLLLISLPGLLLNAASNYLEGILFYNLKFIYHRNVLEFLRLGIMNLLFVLGLNYVNDIRILAFVYSLIAFITFSYSLYKFLNKEKIGFEIKYLNPSYLKSNFTDAFSYWILGISSFVITQTDVFFISTFKRDIGLVTMYSQSFRLQDIALKFIKKITEIKGPKILTLFQSGNHHAVAEIFNKLLKINIALSITAFLLITIWGKYILELWLDKVIIFDQTLICVLSTICITSSIHWVLWHFCNLTGQQKKVKNIVIVEILLNLGLSYLLIRWFGLIGLGLASILANTITIVFIFKLFSQYKKRISVHN